MSTALLQPVVGPYRIMEKLSSSSFIRVFHAINTNTGEHVSFKSIQKDRVRNPKASFESAMMHMKKIGRNCHENVVPLLDFFMDDTYYYAVGTYCEGGDLAEYLARNPHNSDELCATIFIQIARGLEYLQLVGMEHRSVKPSNILFTKFPHLKIAGYVFGSFLSDDVDVSSVGLSIAHFPPEAFDGRGFFLGKSEIWSLGYILCNMVGGRPPWPGNNIVQLAYKVMRGPVSCLSRNDIGNEAKDLISKLMKLEPNERASFEEIYGHPWVKHAKNASDFEKLEASKKSVVKESASHPQSLFRRTTRQSSLPLLVPEPNEPIENLIARSRAIPDKKEQIIRRKSSVRVISPSFTDVI